MDALTAVVPKVDPATVKRRHSRDKLRQGLPEIARPGLVGFVRKGTAQTVK